MKWINLHHLKYFQVIAEEGSLSAASKKLLIGQPALSSQLKLFEESLGIQLFDRLGKKLLLNKAGEFVLKYAKAIKGLEDELILNIGHADQFLQKEMIVACQETVPKSVLSHTIGTIRDALGVKLKIVEGTGEELFHLILNSKADFFIGNFRPMHAGKEMFYKLIGKDRVGVFASKEHTHLKKNFPESLDGKSFILPGFQNQTRHDFEKFMFEKGLNFNIEIEAYDTALLKELTARGEGLTVLGYEGADQWIKSGRLVEIGEIPQIKEEYWIGMVKRAMDHADIKEMLKKI